MQDKCREFTNSISEDVHLYEDVEQQEAGNQLRLDKQAAKQQHQVEKQHTQQEAEKQPPLTKQHQQHQHTFEKQQRQQDSGIFFTLMLIINKSSIFT